MIVSRCLTTAILLVGVLFVGVVEGQSPPAETPAANGTSDSGAPIRFRRMYAPADRPESWPRQPTPYFPMQPDEFERLTGHARVAPHLGNSSVTVAIGSAEYKARLVDDSLVEGRATLEVLHSSARRSMLRLTPCGLAISKAAWAGEESPAAELGQGPDGKLSVVVEKPGKLELNWSLKGQRDAQGTIAFALALPPCPSTHLLLELPEAVTPLADGGLVIKEDKVTDATRRWRIELGGHGPTRLRIVPTSELDSRRQLTRVRQSLVYDISPQGLELSAQLQFDVYDEPLRQVVIALDPRLRLVTARHGSNTIPWSSMAPPPGSETSRVVLEFPEPLQGLGRTVRLRLLAPLQLGTPWSLPGLWPEAVHWQEGHAVLLVASPLLLEQLTPIQSRQVKVSPLPDSKSGESVELQYFSRTAGATVVLGQPRPSPQLNSGTAVELNGGEMTVRLTADFAVTDGEVFELGADVSPQWIIDSVEAFPGEILADWNLEKTDEAGRRLTVRLAKALSPSRPVHLEIAGRWLHSPLGRWLSVNELMPLEFRQVSSGRHVVSLLSVEPYQLKTQGTDRLTLVEPQELDSATARLLNGSVGNLLFERNEGCKDLRVSLELQGHQYAATLRVEAAANEGMLTESYRLNCIPAGAPVDRLVVKLSQRRETPLRWTLVNGAEDALIVKPAPAMGNEIGPSSGNPPHPIPLPEGEGTEGETWEITLRQPQSVPFEIRSSRTTPLAKSQAISLVSLPEATNQRATLIVSSTDANRVRVAGSQLEPIPTEAVPADQYTSARATYRYYPAHSSGAVPKAELTIEPQTSMAGPLMAWAWDCHLESRYSATGQGDHLAVYRLQNSGRRQMQVTLPVGVGLKDVNGVWVDDERAAWQKVEPSDRPRLAVDLPAGRKYPVVAIHYTTSAKPLGFVTRLTPVLPSADLPVLASQWTAWLPPDYEAVEPDSRWQARRLPPRSWMQRLFGFLASDEPGNVFDPLDSDHWAALFGKSPAHQAALDKARRMVLSLGGSIANPNERGLANVDWQTALASPAIEKILADPSASGSRMVLLVDLRAMAQLDLRPDTPLAKLGPGTTNTRGAALLQQAGLTLLVHPAAVVVTSQFEAALNRAFLEPMDNGALWLVRPGPLADRIQEAATSNSARMLVRVAVWRQKPDAVKSPWIAVRPMGLQPSDTVGWRAYRLGLPSTERVSLSVVHHNAIEAVSFAVFLMVLALTSWRLVRRPTLLAALAGLLVAAFLAPAPYGPLVSGAFLGIVFGLAWRLMQREEKTAEKPNTTAEKPSSPSGSKIASGIPSLFLVIVLSSQVLAQESAKTAPFTPAVVPSTSTTPAANPAADAAAPAAKPAPTPVYHVLIPVDKDDKPTGEPYQVPERLYKELHRRAAGTDEPQGWMLTAATYRCTLVPQGTPDRLAPTDLKAMFTLRVFNSQTRVRLRLGRQGIALVPDGATLDGRVIQPEWQENGDVLAFNVAESGQYDLELSLRFTTPQNELQNGFELLIPPLASAQAELSIPPNAPPIEIPSARGAVVRQNDPPRIVAELGSSERLSVRWQGATATAAAGPAIDSDQLLLLKVQPDAVVLDTRFRFRIEGRIQELRFQADPRLRLLPLQGDNAPAVETDSTPGHLQTIRVILPRPVSDQWELAASFLMTETSGIGTLRLPHLEVQDARTTRRWLGVWVDPSLSYEQPGPGQLQAVTVPNFLAAWGPAMVQPLFAYSLAPNEMAWELATQPREPATSALQTIALGVDLDRVEVQLDAQLKTSSGYQFQYRVLAPKELEIDKVSVLAESLEHVSRWTRGADGSVYVFLNAPLSGQQQLSLRGHVALEQKDRHVLPNVRVDVAETSASVILLFRKPGVELRAVEAEGLVEIEPPATSEQTVPLGRLVKSFQVQGDKPSQLQVEIAPNRPKVRCVQRTCVRFDGEQREAKVDFRIRVDEGLVDQWQILVPSQWTGPYQVDPPSTVKVTTIPGDSRRRLSLQPKAAVRGEYRLSVSGPLTLSAGDRVCAPEIVLEGAEMDGHLLVLPTQSQLHPVAWETQGLQQVALPEDFDAMPVGRDSFVAYEVQRPSFQAVLKPLAGMPQVFLADVSLAWRADGTCYGVGQFDLQAAGLTHCWLRLPEKYDLVQVSVAGVPTIPLRDANNRWQVPLSPSVFPQRLEVLFRGQLAEPATDGPCRLEVPTIDDLPIRQTLWTVAGPPQCRPSAGPGIKTVDSLQQEMVRLRNVNTLIEQAAETSTDEPEQTVQWYQAWALRWRGLREEVRRQLAQPLTSDTPQARAERQAIADELETLSAPKSPVASRLAGSQARVNLAEELPRIGSSYRLWLASLDDSSPRIRCVVDGGSGDLTLDYRSRVPGAMISHLSRLLLLAALVGVLAWMLRRGTLGAWIVRWPHTAGVAVGLGWWLWLWPSVLGLAIVLVSLVAAFHATWHQSRKPASMVVTITPRKQ